LIDLYTDHGGTKQETEKLITRLRAQDTTVLQAEEAQLDPSALKSRHYVFIHTDLTHNEVLDKRGEFTLFLKTSVLADR
jgi:aspartate/tyrosine/aromatic aminotransferase